MYGIIVYCSWECYIKHVLSWQKIRYKNEDYMWLNINFDKILKNSSTLQQNTMSATKLCFTLNFSSSRHVNISTNLIGRQVFNMVSQSVFPCMPAILRISVHTHIGPLCLVTKHYSKCTEAFTNKCQQHCSGSTTLIYASGCARFLNLLCKITNFCLVI